MGVFGDQLSFSSSDIGNNWLAVQVETLSDESTWGSGSYTQPVRFSYNKLVELLRLNIELSNSNTYYSTMDFVIAIT